MDSESSDEESDKLVVKTLDRYCSELDGSSEEPIDLLNLALQNNYSCLICLSGIKRVQAVWSCKLCFTVFHLVCIQQWAKDSVVIRNTTLSEDLFPSIPLIWTCPKCRKEYGKAEIPSVYHCFCGKQVNPPPDPWLLAHSCGEFCGKALDPQCGHTCLSLCHPGPCPPCPKTVLLSCYCGRSPARPKRCGFTGWSCGRVCKRTLTCNLHTCERKCHEGSCDECSERVLQACICGKQVNEAPCNQPEWSCGQACNKLLSCLHHFCERECHSGSCGECPRSGLRKCPCGKQSFILDCTFEVPCCGDTCSKPLNCGEHLCVRLCHVGDCGPCLQVAIKSCRCGQKKKSVPCSQEYLCESRCQRIRQCGRHQCRKKCCAGNCPPCEQLCGKTLSCKSHKCAAPCHSGQCYPCILSVSVSCACGETSISVPCGRERSTRPPRCTKLCRLPSLCHHSNPHRCHPGKCPPCQQPCSLPLPCNHLCRAPCHSQPTPLLPTKPLPPWKKVEPTLVVKPCPPCQTPVLRACYGGHQKQEMPCSELKGYSCGQLCGRQLLCGNHLCQRICHTVINAQSLELAGEDCFTCVQPCKKSRHPDCEHKCPLPCHSGDCPPCDSSMKHSCHCSSTILYIKCSQWCSADSQARDAMRMCNGQCSKKLLCGHLCPQPCHPGPCISAHQCRRKVTVRCPCRRLKKEWRCNEKQDLQCSEDCWVAMQKQKEIEAEAAAAAAALKEQSENDAKAALERQLRPKKRKRRTTSTKEENVDASSSHYLKMIWFVLLAVAIALGLGGLASFR